MGTKDPSEQRQFIHARIDSNPHYEKHVKRSRRASSKMTETYGSTQLLGWDVDLQSAVANCCKPDTGSEYSLEHSCSYSGQLLAAQLDPHASC